MGTKPTPALQVGGTWYLTDKFATSHDLAHHLEKHFADQSPTVLDLTGLLDTTAGSGDSVQPTHVVVDRNGRMVPLGVLTHGTGDAPSR